MPTITMQHVMQGMTGAEASAVIYANDNALNTNKLEVDASNMTPLDFLYAKNIGQNWHLCSTNKGMVVPVGDTAIIDQFVDFAGLYGVTDLTNPFNNPAAQDYMLIQGLAGSGNFESNAQFCFAPETGDIRMRTMDAGTEEYKAWKYFKLPSSTGVTIPRIGMVESTDSYQPIQVSIVGHSQEIEGLNPCICLVYTKKKRKNHEKVNTDEHTPKRSQKNKTKIAICHPHSFADDPAQTYGTGYYGYPVEIVEGVGANRLYDLRFIAPDLPATPADLFNSLLEYTHLFDPGGARTGYFCRKNKRTVRFSEKQGANIVFNCGMCVRVDNPEYLKAGGRGHLQGTDMYWYKGIPKYLYGEIKPIRLCIAKAVDAVSNNFTYSVTNRI